jgi:spermidine/putrescine transport system substrate-binding protein
MNFSDWNGYQPPFTTIDPDRLVDEGVVPEAMSSAVVTEDMFTTGYQQSELPPEVDQIWADEWARIQAGG